MQLVNALIGIVGKKIFEGRTDKLCEAYMTIPN